MRVLDAAALAAQSLPDPEATVVARFRRRSTFAGDPLLWRVIFKHTTGNVPYGDRNVTAAACACAESGVVLRVLRSGAAKKVGVQRFNCSSWQGDGSAWSPAAAAALTKAPAQVGALSSTSSEESIPGLWRSGNEIRIGYGDGNRLYIVKSTDDGKTWGTPSLVYDGGLDYLRFSDISLCNVGSTWIIMCSAFNRKRKPKLRAMHSSGSAWVQWPDLESYTDWQVAGVRVGPDGKVYTYLWGADYDSESGKGWNSLACQAAQVNASGAFVAWGERVVVDRAGVAGAAAYGRVRFGQGGGAYLFALQERAAKGYWFVSSLYALPGNADMEEPVYLGTADGGAARRETLQPLSAGRRAWLFGAGEVWASAMSDAAVDLQVRTYTPISYRYTASASGGGELTLRLERSVSETSPIETFAPAWPPQVYVGDMLWLDRTLRVGENQGTQTYVFRVAAVRHGRSKVEVTAFDGLGVLAHMRPRRAKVLAEGDRTRMADVEALCHWAGLKVLGAAAMPNAVYPSPGFVWKANESGLGALRRYLGDQAVTLRSAIADNSQDHTHVQVATLPTASCYTYVAPYGKYEELGTHEISDWELNADSRSPRLYVAVGMKMRNSPVGGEGWALASARPLDGTRPVPVVAVDRSWADSDGSLSARAEAEALRLGAGVEMGWIEATANLGIELYDVVTVDQTEARVAAITETWDRGRLMQRLSLAVV